MRAASSDSQYDATNAEMRATSSSVTAGYQLRTISTSGGVGAERSTIDAIAQALGAGTA